MYWYENKRNGREKDTAKINKRIYSIDNTALSQRSTKHHQKEEIEKRREKKKKENLQKPLDKKKKKKEPKEKGRCIIINLR